MKKRLGVLFLLFALMFSSVAMASDLVSPDRTDVVGGAESFYQLGDISVSLDTAVATRTLLQGDSTFVILNIESVSGEVSSAGVTINGLMPSSTYYLYVDNMFDGQEIVSDAQGQFSFSQDLSGPHMITIKEQPSTYFISSEAWTDGSGVVHPAGWSYSDGTDLNGVVGTWDPETLTATMITDLDDQIQVLSSRIILDGAGHNLTRNPELSRYTDGIYSYNRDILTIKNITFSGWYQHISLRKSSMNTITKNTFLGGGWGIHIDYSQANKIYENVFDGVGGLDVFPISWGTTFNNNIVRNCSTFAAMMGLTGSTTYADNIVENTRVGISVYNSTNNIVRGNTFDGMDLVIRFSKGSRDAVTTRYAKVYNNNFINISGDPIQDDGIYNTFSEPLPVGGNYYDNLTSPDVNNDGFVDTPRPIYDRYGVLKSYDNLPYIRENGWIPNQAPEFVAFAPLEVVEYEQINLPLEVTDPDGDAIITVYAENLPDGALFDPVARTFSWRPDGTQAGNYIVNFFAVDSATPSATGQLDVIITVGEVVSPDDMNATLTTEVETLELLPEVAFSYSANLMNADMMIETGKVIAVVNQYEAILHKIQQDLKQDKISQADADVLSMMTNDAINLLN